MMKFARSETTVASNAVASNTVCGFDKNHFSKPVLLSYARGYIDYRDLIAVIKLKIPSLPLKIKGLNQQGMTAVLCQ